VQLASISMVYIGRFEETCALNLKVLFFPFFLGTSFDFIYVEQSIPQLGRNEGWFFSVFQQPAHVHAHEMICCKSAIVVRPSV